MATSTTSGLVDSPKIATPRTLSQLINEIREERGHIYDLIDTLQSHVRDLTGKEIDQLKSSSGDAPDPNNTTDRLEQLKGDFINDRNKLGNIVEVLGSSI